MKKAYTIKLKHLFKVVLMCICLFLFNSGCGLDVYYVVNPPSYNIHTPYYDSEFSNCYFEFRTNENNNNTEVKKFLGTAIYYKIYKSKSKMDSEVGSITSLINSTDNKANAAPRLTSTYNFKTLKAENLSGGVLIEHNDSSDQNVFIRLTDYIGSDGQVVPGYEAVVKIGDTSYGKPLRDEDNLNFNFASYRTDEKSAVPQEGDSDVQENPTSTDSEDDNKWYVPLFAVGLSLNDDYTNTSSVPLYLGCVTIKDNEEDN